MLEKVEQFIFENICDNVEFLQTYSRKDIKKLIDNIDYEQKKELLEKCNISFWVTEKKRKKVVETWFSSLIESYFEVIKNDQ